MAEQRRFWTKGSLCLGVATLALCFGCSSSDAGSGPAGSSAGGSSAGASNAGASNAGASSAGASNAGASGASAGATSGGGGGGGVSGSATGGSSGVTDRGGASDCGECFVANQCLDHCGGTVVYTGCCACVAPAIDKNTCPKP